MASSAFYAYPSKPKQIGKTIRSAIKLHKSKHPGFEVSEWTQNEVAGSFIVDPILDEIQNSDIVFADITGLNFNVVFEIGYAVGLGKKVVLTRYKPISDDQLIREVGIFDTIGYISYSQDTDLERILSDSYTRKPIFNADAGKIERTSPVYIVLPSVITDIESRINSRVKKARLQFRTYDPNEVGRLSGRAAIDEVAKSAAITTSYLPEVYVESQVHNTRVAFIAGLAIAMDKKLVVFSPPDENVALDFRDIVKPVAAIDAVDPHIATMASDVTAALQQSGTIQNQNAYGKLAELDLGASAAENELGELRHYFVKTDEFFRLLRGEAQILSGRKGSGKTALFIQVRNEIRKVSGRIILDLMPEGYQLLKFKEKVLDLMAEGAREHTVSAFWEYLLLLEVCHKVIRNDRQRHLNDHTLHDGYRQIAELYASDQFVAESDFSERLRLILGRIETDFSNKYGGRGGKLNLADSDVNGLIYRHDLPKLRRVVLDYVKLRGGLWILVDNLDKGWPSSGLNPDDALILRSLVDSIKRIGKDLRRLDADGFGTVFLRDDVYDNFVAGASDRAKARRLKIDWQDADLLREVLRRRIAASLGLPKKLQFSDVWDAICCSHFNGEETSQYLIDRCLMRPRALLDLVNSCKSHAVNLRRERIEPVDIVEGVRIFSTDMVENVNFEIQDVSEVSADLLYAFVETPVVQTEDDVGLHLLEHGVDEGEIQRIMELLFYYAVFGVKDGDGVKYIYNYGYDMKKMSAVIRRRRSKGLFLSINPAFWDGLEIAAV